MPGLLEASPYAAGGVGLAALENKYIAPNIPEELKRVNLGIGGVTGYLMASPDPKIRLAALSSLPLKQISLFGIGAVDKLRRQQQSLVDANLQVARVNKATADVQRSNAESAGTRSNLFLLPALAAGGAAAYWAIDKWRKARQAVPRYDTLGGHGQKRHGQKIKVEIPATAMPDEFYHSLVSGENNPRASERIMQLNTVGNEPGIPLPKAAAAVLKSAATHMSVPGLVWDMAKEMTGVPALHRMAVDAGRSYGNYDAGNTSEATRYGAGALGNAAMAGLSVRTGLYPAINWAFPRYVAYQAGTGGPMAGSAAKARSGILGTPTFAKMIDRWSAGNSAATAALNARYAYNPARYSWTASAETPGWFKSLLTGAAGTPRGSLVGHLTELPRYGMNRAVNAGYWAKQLSGRHPLLTLAAVGLPLAGLGVVRDRERHAQAMDYLKRYRPSWGNQQGPFGLPISYTLSNVASLFGKGQGTPLMQQMQGAY